MAPRHCTVSIDSIVEKFFVRQSLNDDHVLHLASLYEGGVAIAPIKVTRGHEVIDGRHRLAALRLLDRKGVDVIYSDETSQSALIVEAVKANLGGSLPATNKDITHSMKQMLEQGMTQVSIIREFSTVWPASVVRRYLADAQTYVRKERIIKAKTLVLEENITVKAAAEMFGLKTEQLKEAMTPDRSKRRSNSAEFKGALTSIFRSRGGSMANIMKNVQRKYQDGDIGEKSVEEIIEHLEKCTKATVSSAKDWAARLRAVRS